MAQSERTVPDPGERPSALGSDPRRPRALVRLAAILVAAAAALPACESGERAPAPAPPTTAPVPAGPASTPLAPIPAVDPHADQPLIDHLTWTEGLDGPRLLVHPTLAGRQTTFSGSDERAWQEVLGHTPDANTPGMRDQFVCHWVWARMVQPDKPSWNLEPWRPAVGYPATVEAHCNPGGPER